LIVDDLLQEFLTETGENMDLLDVELVKLEQNPNDPELLGNIFRMVHTIKGTCGFLGLPRLESVAHAGENVLGKVRDGILTVTPDAVSLVLGSLDRIKELLTALEETGSEPEGSDSDLIDQLNAFAESGDAAPAEPEPAAEPEAEAGSGDAMDDALQAAFDAAEYKGPGTVVSADDSAASDDKPAEMETKPEADAPTASVPATADGAAVPASGGAPKGPSVANQSIRVSVDVLETLMTMVSELVLTRNQLLQLLRHQKDSEFTAPLQRLSHVTTELQEGVMKTRMQPIGNAWAKLPRIVRDLSLELSKKMDLQMIGAETELDRQVLELIKDPLTHMVRNSADHGLEPNADRVAAGKAETGTITLNAFHEGGHIVIEISDDGAGLNSDRIKEKVLKNGLATENELEALNDQQIHHFIFRPGFSTATEVTAVSGRGVGMDVVRTNIEMIGGTIELNSEEGKGTTFTIKIPLTLAIVSALIIECAGERFAVPQISVLELVLAGKGSVHKIERIQGTPVLRLRNRLLPLVSLRGLLKIEDTAETAETDFAEEETFVIVSQVGQSVFGIIVDRVYDTEEIVVKPTSPVLRNLSVFSGNTILGDGSVIMILDPNGIAGEVGEVVATDHMEAAEAHHRISSDQDRETLLLFKGGDDVPKAVPLALVARLEEIEGENIEFTNGKPITQYRGKLMPLIPVADNIEVKTESGRQPVLVFTDGDRSMGLVVSEIIDIIEERLSIELGSEKKGIFGSAIISGSATDIIDTGYFLGEAHGDWFGKDGISHGASADGNGQHQVLLVDDSAFFRNLLTPMLSLAGYNVTAVETAGEALEMRESGREFDIIISDIEMPEMNGFEFASEIRENGNWSGVPLVALSSRSTPDDMERGREVGFTDYVAKFDREGLLQTLQDTLRVPAGNA
jgi:two-component system, chemotaxis family, sensor kinase CheA